MFAQKNILAKKIMPNKFLFLKLLLKNQIWQKNHAKLTFAKKRRSKNTIGLHFFFKYFYLFNFFGGFAAPIHSCQLIHCLLYAVLFSWLIEMWFKRRFSGTLRVFQGEFKGCFRCLSTVFWGLFQGYFRCVPGLFQSCLKDIFLKILPLFKQKLTTVSSLFIRLYVLNPYIHTILLTDPV